MAKKKFLAYAKSNEGIYINNENSETPKLFNIWEVLRMKEGNRNVYDQLTFWSIPRNEKFRKEMIAVKNAFFRYKSVDIDSSERGQGETITHSVAIEVLSQMKELPFQFGKEQYIFKVEDCSEISRFQFGEDFFYYPDLYIRFSEPKYFSKKWGEKVAIEVFVTHQVEDRKKKDFKNHNIPIIEISISEKLHFSKKEFNENDYLRYSSFLKERFSKLIYASIKVDVETADFRKETFVKNEENLKQLRCLNQKYFSEMSEREEVFSKKTTELNARFISSQRENEILKTEISSLNNRTFLKRLKDLF